MKYDKFWIDINKSLLYNRAFYHTPSALARSAYLYVTGVGHFICDKHFYLKRENYKCYLVKYTLSGSAILDYRGKQYTLHKNQVFIIDCTDFQEYYTYNCNSWENKWVHFAGGLCQEYFNIIYENYGPVIDIPENSNIPKYIDQLINWMEDEDRLFEIKASPIILEILTSILLSASSASNSSKNICEQRYIETALEFIEQNYHRDILTENIAKAANISPFHFSRLFKKAMGYTIYEYLTKYRINKAKSLLLHTGLPIEEIAFKVGFREASSFIRVFKKLESTTPLKYRKSK